MRRRRVRDRAAAAAPLLAVVVAGCGADEVCVDGRTLWEEPPQGPICVSGDLVVEGRGPDDLGVLARVTSIEGSLFIYENPTLAKLPAWPALSRIGGSLSISGNQALVTVDGFPALDELGGGVYVAENPALVRLELGDGVTSVDSLFIALNPRLTELAGLAGLAMVGGDVRFADNAALEALELPKLAEVGVGFFIVGNPELRTAEFPALRSVPTWVIEDNPALLSLTGFPALEHVVNASIRNNDALVELRLTSPFAPYLLDISHNNSLVRLEGSADLRLPGSLSVTENPALAAIEGFAGIEALTALKIRDTVELREISGFSALRRVSSRIDLIRNYGLQGADDIFPALSQAGAVWIFDNFMLAPAIVDALLARMTVEGETKVGDNAGEDTALDPCPWPDDGLCDSDWGFDDYLGSRLCVNDAEDCGE